MNQNRDDFNMKQFILLQGVTNIVLTTASFIIVLVLLIYVFQNQSNCSSNLPPAKSSSSNSLSVPCTAATFPLFLWMLNEFIHWVLMLSHRIIVFTNQQVKYILILYAYRYYSYFHYLCSFVSSAAFVSLWAHSYNTNATQSAIVLLAQQILLVIAFGVVILCVPHFWSSIYSRDTLFWDGRLFTWILPIHAIIWAVTFSVRNIGWFTFVFTVGLPYWVAKTAFTWFSDLSQFEEICEMRYAMFPRYFKEGRYLPQGPYIVSGGPAFDCLLTSIAFVIAQIPVSFAIACWALSESEPYSVFTISSDLGPGEGIFVFYTVMKTLESINEVVLPLGRLYYTQRISQFRSIFVHLQGSLILSVSCFLLEKIVASLDAEIQGDGGTRYVITKLGPSTSASESVPLEDLLKLRKEELENKRTERDKLLGENAAVMDTVGAILFDYDNSISDDVANFAQRCTHCFFLILSLFIVGTFESMFWGWTARILSCCGLAFLQSVELSLSSVVAFLTNTLFVKE